MTKPYLKCLDSHPPLLIGGVEVYGGSCHKPRIKNAHVYVSLDIMWDDKNPKKYPWVPGYAFQFPIPDMGVPESKEEFLQLIVWLGKHVQDGHKIHIGCIGGHGRTGMVLAALVKAVTGDKNATQYVRDNYCDKAVESQAQIDFLFDNFNINKVKANKVAYTVPDKSKDLHLDFEEDGTFDTAFRGRGRSQHTNKNEPSKRYSEKVLHTSKMSIWGSTVTIDP